MGVDYTPVAGFTIPITEALQEKVAKLAKEKVGDDYQNWVNDFNALGISTTEVGWSIEGESYYIPMLRPQKPFNTIGDQIQAWLTDINQKIHTSFTLDDVEFTVDLRVW